MRKKPTYRINPGFKWVLALSLSISFVVYAGYISTLEACEPQPEQIELIESGYEYSVNNSVFYYQVVAQLFPLKVLLSQKVHKTNLRFDQQSSITVTLARVLKCSYTFISPVFFYQLTSIPSFDEDSSPLISGRLKA